VIKFVKGCKTKKADPAAALFIKVRLEIGLFETPFFLSLIAMAFCIINELDINYDTG
jgi:hypothetical protein